MTRAIDQLIDEASRLHASGEIGDGKVAQFNTLAARARVEMATDDQVRARLRLVAEGSTINGTYRLPPGEALEAFRADLRALVGGKPPPKPDSLAHASTSPGPINCSRRLSFQGQASPRHCGRCGLGPCPFFNEDGSATRKGLA